MSTYAGYLNGIKETNELGDNIANAYFFIPEAKDNHDVFEYFKKFNLIQSYSIDWLEGYLKAMEIELFGLWASNQFTIWGSKRWSQRDTLIKKLQIEYNQHRKALSRVKN